jgi:hypothetical protein
LQVRDPADCAAHVASLDPIGWAGNYPYFSWAKGSQNCYACTPQQTAERVRRNDGFNIYRTGDYAANLPSAKVRFGGRGCGTLIAKTTTTAQACAAATAAAGSLPYFTWSETNGFCFACAEASEQSAPASGYDIYASDDFDVSFEEVKKWLAVVEPLRALAEGEARAPDGLGFADVAARARAARASRAAAATFAMAAAVALVASRRRARTEAYPRAGTDVHGELSTML